MKHYEYVKKSEYMPVKKELIELINLVQDDLRDKFTFRFDFIGSSSRNMITCDYPTNEGYDFDVNIEVNDPDDKYNPKKLKEYLMQSFNKKINEIEITNNHGYQNVRPSNYSNCQNGTRVFTIRVYEPFSNNKKIRYGCDFAIVNNFIEYGRKKQKYIHYNKRNCTYSWQLQEKGYDLFKKEQFISKNKLVSKLKKLYLDKKNNNNTDQNKKSRSLYAEAVNEIYDKYN